MFEYQNIVTIESYCIHNNIHWSDLFVNGEIIGALAEKQCGILSEMKVWVQCLVPEKYKEMGDHYYISEISGYVYLCFYDYEGINKLLDFKKICL